MPRTTRRRISADGSAAGPSVARRITHSSTLASVNRIAVNGSAGIWPMASFVTLKLTPQIRQTSSMPASWTDRRKGGEGGDGGEDERPADGLVTPQE